MATNGMLRPEDAKSLLLLVLLISGYAALERGSTLIEPRDLIKAIYIVDLEHVQTYWGNWEGFESLVSGRDSAEVRPEYINRAVYLARVEIDQSRGPEGCFRGVGNLSEVVREMIGDARTLASERVGGPSTPSSRDLLFSIYARDPSLSKALQNSSLNLESLSNAVKPGAPGSRPL